MRVWIYVATAWLLAAGCGRINYDPLGDNPDGPGIGEPGIGPDASTGEDTSFLCAPSSSPSCPNLAQYWNNFGISSFGGPTAGRGDSTSGSCGGAGTPEITGHGTAVEAGRFRIDSTGTDFPHVLYLLADDCGGSELACSTDGVLEIDLAANQTVVVVVDGVDGQCGSADVRMTKVN